MTDPLKITVAVVLILLAVPTLWCVFSAIRSLYNMRQRHNRINDLRTRLREAEDEPDPFVRLVKITQIEKEIREVIEEFLND
jgi:hypothetical protein